MRAITIASLLTISLTTHSGQYHVCTDANGKKLFSQQPCPSDTASEVKTYKQSQATAQPATSRLSTDNPTYQAIRDNNRRLELERNIRKSQSKIKKLSDKMDRELKSLKNKKRYANNNAAGAAWEQSISTEMQAVSDRYGAMIATERDDLKDMRDELRSLN